MAVQLTARPRSLSSDSHDVVHEKCGSTHKPREKTTIMCTYKDLNGGQAKANKAY